MADGTNLIAGRFVSSAPVLAEGEVAPVRVTEAGELVVADRASLAASPTSYFAGDTAGDVIDPGAFELVSLGAMNAGASSVYLHVFDGAAVPPNGTAPLLCFTIPAGGGVLVDSTWLAGLQVATGITWGISTTPATFTASTGFSGTVSILYRPAV